MALRVLSIGAPKTAPVARVPTLPSRLRVVSAPPAADVVRASTFGLPGAETIGAPTPLSATDLFPTTARQIRQPFGANPLQVGGTLVNDLLSLILSPLSRTLTAIKRAPEGRPAPTFREFAKTGLQSQDPLENIAGAGVEAAVGNVLAPAVTGVARRAGRAIQAAPGKALQADILASVKANRAKLTAGQTIPEELLKPSAAVEGATDFDILASREAAARMTPGQVEVALKQRSVPRLIVKRIAQSLGAERGAAYIPKPGDVVRFGDRVLNVLEVDPKTRLAILGAGAERAATAKFNELTPAAPPIVQPTPVSRLKPLTAVRTQAIRAVTDDLREQAQLMIQESRLLKQRVMESGGIKPTVGGGLREELQAIRPFLRTTGQPIDTLATELGFEDGEALRSALMATRGVKLPSVAQLRQQAMHVIDSEPGRRILDTLQTSGVTKQSIQRVVREVTTETNREVSQGLQQVRGLLRTAQSKALTPTQVGRLAKEQRIVPGETLPGPRGGVTPAPLSPADLAQVEVRAAGVVPPPGQPTGTPPVLPRSKALIPADVPRPQRDLNQLQSTPLSGLDPSRAAQVIDGTPLGPTERQVIQPLRQGELAMRRDQQQLLKELRQVSGNMRRGSTESRQVFQILEQRFAASATLAPRVRETAAWLSDRFDELLERVNVARTSVGKIPIVRRQNYITHITDPTFWESMREVFGNVPDDASVTLADQFYESLRARGPGFKFGLPRTGGAFQEDAIAAFEAYLPAALRVQHLSVPAKLAGAYVNRSLAGTPNAHAYFSQLIRQAATGEAGPIAKLTPKAIVRASNWIKGRFGKGTILGNLSSVLQQVYSLPATVAGAGPQASTVAGFWLARGNGLTFASQWSTVLQGRAMELDTDLQGLFGRWEQALGWMFQAADRQMVAHSFLSGYVKAVSEGKDFRAAVEAGDLLAQRTQASFLKADTPPIFRDAVTSSFLQFQGSINGVFNFMTFDIPKSQHPFKAAALFVGTFVGLVAIYEALGLPHPDRLSELIPGFSTMRSGGPVGLRLLTSFMHLGDSDVRKRSQAIKDLRNASFAVVLGPGGNQFRKSLDGFMVVQRGGKFTKKGQLQFPVEGPVESARAIAFGPYGTKAGQRYIKRGFKPEKAAKASRPGRPNVATPKPLPTRAPLPATPRRLVYVR